MRDFKGMKRQRGRNRGGGQGGGQGGGGGGKPQHNINRAFDSNGPDNIKVRGNAQLVYEKYQALARDATLAGDRVLAENYLQHAEHYFRTLRAIQPNRAASDIVSRDAFSSGYDIDFEDEAVETAMEQADAQAAARAAEPQPEPGAEGEAPSGEGQPQPQQQQPRFDRDRDANGQRREWRDRNDRPQNEYRGDRPRYEGDRNDRPQGESRDRQQGYQGDRQQNDRAQNDRPQGERFQGDRFQADRPQGELRDRGDRPRYRDRDDRYRGEREPRVDNGAQAAGAPGGDAPRGDRPTRDDRPAREDRDVRRLRDRDEASAEGEGMPPTREAPAMLRSEDGGVSELPGFLQPAASAGAEEGERRPRTRTRRKPRDDADSAAATPEVEEV